MSFNKETQTQLILGQAQIETQTWPSQKMLDTHDFLLQKLALSAGALEYTDCIFAKG